jgi:hypothetical protein
LSGGGLSITDVVGASNLVATTGNSEIETMEHGLPRRFTLRLLAFILAMNFASTIAREPAKASETP